MQLKLFPQIRRNRESSWLRKSKVDLLKTFERAYESVNTPICLCNGLEVVACNASFTELLALASDKINGSLINTYFANPIETEQAFQADADGIELNIVRNDSSVSVPVHMRFSIWREHPHYKLLQWQELSAVKSLQSELQLAKETDAPTGALLPGGFTRFLSQKLSVLKEKHRSGVLVWIDLQQNSGDAETENDIVTTIAHSIFTELGNKTLVCRCQSTGLKVFTETSADEREAQYVLRQISRLCRKLNLEPKICGSIFPSHGDSQATLEAGLELTRKAMSDDQEPRLFESKYRDDENRRSGLAHDMATAIQQNEITPFYQPVIHSRTGKIKGFEALIRWIHPEFGYVIPPEIIAIAMETGQLDTLTKHVIQQTLHQIKDWPDDIQFAVNVTPSQLTSDLVDLVRQSVRDADIDPSRLEIEVTEDALISDFTASSNILARLRAIGVAVAMDDFGAGYTSVGNLRKLEFTKFKIDKVISDGLPHDKRSVAIVKSLMFMAKELEVEITVEGIEEQEQLDLLRQYDCGIQGYVFSPPVPASALSDMKKFRASSSISHNSSGDSLKKMTAKAQAH